jgi:hypothetical protein
MNSPLREITDNFNHGYTYLRDNNGAVNRELVVVNLLKNKFCWLFTSNWTFVRDTPWILRLYNVMLTLEEHKSVFRSRWIGFYSSFHQVASVAVYKENENRMRKELNCTNFNIYSVSGNVCGHTYFTKK